MPGGQERKLRRRMKGVQSTKKITRAMELIAASRIVKAQERVAAARPYSEQITEVIRNLVGAGAGLEHPLLEEREQRTAGFVVMAADRGLAGAYNTSVSRTANRALEGSRQEGKEYFLVLVGRKVESYFRYRGYQAAETFTGFTEKPAYEDARAVAAPILRAFEEREVDSVDLVYTRFLSPASQRVVTSRLLPLEKEAMEDMASDGSQAAYEFEPEPQGILELLLPRYVEARIYAALLDAAASEHAARQRAMKAATDNAEELMKTLGVEANKMRQAGITTEIMDIVGGAEALTKASR